MQDMKQTWPPIGWLWGRHSINRAWYSGEPDKLKKASGFWRGKETAKYHVPIPHELSSMAASMLFGGSPEVTVDDETQNERLQDILNENGFYSKLLQAAETQSAMGGVFLKVNWDTSLVPYPILTVVPADEGLPIYQNGILTGCEFWSQQRAEENTGIVYRLREVYDRDGGITATLYRGDAANLGTETQLTAIPETRAINPKSISGAGMLLATYIPGNLPNRIYPSAPYGMSDYAGLYDLFDALDETYSAMLRDVRLGKSRIVVPMEFLRRKDTLFKQIDSEHKEVEWVFDGGQEIFTALDINPQDSGAGITFVQPDMRAEQYRVAINDIIHRIYTLAGYSPQTAGLDMEGRAESGTALNIRERRTMQTIDAKRAAWWHGIRDIVTAMLAVDKSVFSGPGGEDVSVDFADGFQPDLQTIADTLEKLDRAGAVTVEQKVRMVNPDMSEEDVQEAVALIYQEKGLIGESPIDPLLGDNENPQPQEPGDDE